MNDIRSREARYFEQLYQRDLDPWRFATSAYERAKYAATIDALGQRRFARALEVGCSIGVLTQHLADCCDAILGIDIAAAPLRMAKAYCCDRPQITFRRMAVPDQWPAGSFDLIILSEVLYFLSPADICRLVARVTGSLSPGGLILLVNWLGATDNPCSGDEAASLFIEACQANFSMGFAQRTVEYRLDLLHGPRA
jgi:2-polyprenyl-3-methyl-5-hydroxy-6-metoxy-1,4-benzoquinol methylase